MGNKHCLFCQRKYQEAKSNVRRVNLTEVNRGHVKIETQESNLGECGSVRKKRQAICEQEVQTSSKTKINAR